MRTLAALGALALLAFSCSSGREPFYGDHQGGIATAPQKFGFVAAFDLTVTDAAEVRELFKAWTKAAEALTQGGSLGAGDVASAPPGDTGEVLGAPPARLTLTFGVGPSVFDGRFGLADRRPAALAPLPAFAGDQLRPQWSDGDLVVQAAADDLATAYHAVHTLTRAAKGRAKVRWVLDGFQAPRNLQGFLDGTVNPDVKNPQVMDEVVWAGQDTDWMAGGSYLVVRRIRMLVEVWDRSSLGDQQRTIGRDRARGEKLAAPSPDAHIEVARGTGAEQILRRPFSYVAGLDERTGQWDSGLLFLAWMKDPTRQFVPMQTRLSSSDLLNEYIQVQGSAVFAVFPGVEKGSYLGARLFPEAPLASRIEGLLAAVGALYPALGRQDWTEVRSGAAQWKALWKKERDAAAGRARDLEDLAQAWYLSLSPEVPDEDQVRAAQKALVASLTGWLKAVQAKPQASVTDLRGLREDLTAVETALARDDVAAARLALSEFQNQWLAREALVRNLDAGAYGAIEADTGTLRRHLASEPPASTSLSEVRALAVRLDNLSSPASFGPWDAGFLLLREGLEALLVLAALLTFLTKTNQSARAPWVWAGAGTGLAASVAVGLGISLLLSGWLGGTAPVLVEGLTGLAAVALMLTVGFWLHGKAAVKTWNTWMKQKMGAAGNSPWALAALAFTAVLREGAETVVFFWGLAGSVPPLDLALGVGGALVVLALLGVAMIGFSKRLPLQWFFPVATGLIYYLAVKILGQSLASLQAAGWLSATPLGLVPRLDWMGFTPTWETAVPQLILLVILTAAVAAPLVRGTKKG